MSESRDARLSALGFDLARQRTAREYLRKRIALAAVRVAVYVGISAGLLAGFTHAVKAWASAFGGGLPQWVLYTVALYLLYWLPVIPLGIVGGLVLERKYGISSQRTVSWFGDAAKGLSLGLGFSILAVVVVYGILTAQPEVWWAYTWLVGLAAGLFLAWIGPVVIAPMFYRFEPLADEALAARMRSLAERTGAKVVGVYRMIAAAKTTRAFGGLAGIGSTRRMILSDTLLDRYTADEVEVVVAHEIAHHVNRDIARLLAAGAIGSLLGLLAVDRILRAAVPALRLDGIADIAGLPLVAVTIAAVSATVSPVLNALSRRRETKADEFALHATGNVDAFRSTMVKIHDQNLGVADPNALAERLFHDHPSGRRRVEAALRLRM